MKLTRLIAVVMAFAGISRMSDVLAQRSYDPKAVETLQGKVLSV
jgi:hypothetical protein